MKSKEEIKQLGSKYALTHEDVSDKLGKYLVSACFQDGYTQCQKDMAIQTISNGKRRIAPFKQDSMNVVWENGYQIALLDNKDKKYTEEDIREAITFGQGMELWKEEKQIEDFINSLNKQD